MSFWKKICCSFIFILSHHIVFSREYETLHVCSEAGFIPFEMKDSNGKWSGYDIDLVRNFSNYSGRSIIIVDMKFDGLIPALLVQGGGCDMIASAVGINKERKKITLFSNPTYESAYAGVTRAENENQLKKYEQINRSGVKIAVQQGTEAASYVKRNFPKAQILSYEDNSVPINAVVTKKADIYIDDSVYTAVAVKRNPQNLFYVPPKAFPKNKYSGMGFVFKKKDLNLRDEFNRYFEQIKKNGELEKLQKYYFVDMGWMENQKSNRL